jgi:hypothetical protein
MMARKHETLIVFLLVAAIGAACSPSRIEQRRIVATGLSKLLTGIICYVIQDNHAKLLLPPKPFPRACSYAMHPLSKV